MFDLQRNLLTTLLAAAIGLLALVGLGMAVFMGRPNVDAIAPAGDTEPASVEVDVPESGLEEFGAYSAILERPLFFSDRQLPVVEVADVEDEGAVEEEPEEEIEDLKARVAGIVITPEMKLAMVADEAAGKTFVLREGMSLEGEQAAWKLQSIEPRQVGFVSVDGRQTRLELKVNTEGLQSVSRRREDEQTSAETSPTDAQAEPESPTDQISEEARARAEEIRRRVAERRAQLRAEAERRAKQREQQQDNDG